MKIVLKNLKSIFLNFKYSPKKALLASYPLTVSNETSILLVVLFAVISGLSSILFANNLITRVIAILDDLLEKYNLGGMLNSYMNNLPDSYKPDSLRSFIIGVILFICILIVCAVISYSVRTNLFKRKDNFMAVIKTTMLSLIPAVILLFIASVLLSVSLLAYLIFIILSIAAFVIYLYEHLGNITQSSKDTLCFICSIAVIVILFIINRLG